MNMTHPDQLSLDANLDRYKKLNICGPIAQQRLDFDHKHTDTETSPMESSYIRPFRIN